MTAESGGSVCSKRSAWICAFLSILVFGFTAHLAAVLTPSWQYVYLEDGRTEHHHGLWLDCKRDYSNEYGRPREYYESLYRINHLQNPFDQFWLPHLQCVFKFDYWIDDEDWYEHGYDENRLQGDAYQHLFIGWKISAFTAHSFALVCSLNAIIMLFCGFYHRLLICVAAVLVTLSTISTVIGNGIFYMFASYQDNNIIREDDGIYEQYFGWSFYASLVANLILLIAAVIGCTATSAILSSERTRLVKIEMDEAGDGARLLRMNGVGGFTKNRSYADNQQQNSGADSDESVSRFRRSKSAVYKIDSNALRKWEKDAMRGVALSSSVPDFKRANSLPNVGKKNAKAMEGSRQSLHKGLSNSDLSNTLLSDVSSSAAATVTTREFIPSRELPTAKRPDLPSRISKRTDNELIYECVDENSMPFEDNNSSVFASKTGTFDRNQWLKPISNRNEIASIQAETTTMNTYDRVPMGALDLDTDEYLKPRSVSSGNNSDVSINGGAFCGVETTFVAKPSFLSVRKQQELENENQKKMLCSELQQKQQQRLNQQQRASDQFGRNKSVFEHEIFEREERLKCSTNFGVKNSAENRKNETNTPTADLTALNAQKSGHRNYPLPTAPYLTLKNDETRDHLKKYAVESGEESFRRDSAIPYFQINTFQTESTNGTHASTKTGTLTVGNSANNNRSLVNLVNVASDQASTVSVFDRRDSVDFSAELDAALRSPQPLSLTSTTPTRRTADSTAATNNWRSPSRAANTAQPKHHYFGSFGAANTSSAAMFDDAEQTAIKETDFTGSNFAAPTKGYYRPPGSVDGISMCAESEMDRSMGSTTFTFNQPAGNSPGSYTSSITTSPWRQKSALQYQKHFGGSSERTMI